MSRRTLLALASLSAIALDGCLLNWNQFRAGDAAADTAVADSRTDTGVREDTGVPADTGIDTGVETDTGVDTGVPTDTMTAMDASDARSDVQDSGVPADATDAARDATDSGPLGDADLGCTGPVVINEVQHTGSSGSDEFIEIHNNGTCEVSLDGWRIAYLTGSATMSSTPQDLFVFGPTHRLAPNAELIVAGASFMPSGTFLRILSGRGVSTPAGVALFDRTMTRVDSVVFGAVATTHPFGEPDSTMPAVTPGTSRSIGRSPNGVDTNHNITDFREFTTPTPGAPNM